MSKTQTKPAPAAAQPKTSPIVAAAKAAVEAVDAASDRAVEAAVARAPREGKAPGGVPWVKWFQEGFAAGKDPKALQEEYFELRKKEPAYAGNEAKLKRHAYRHRAMALPQTAATK